MPDNIPFSWIKFGLYEMHCNDAQTLIEQQKKTPDVLYRYGFFILMLSCMLLASTKPSLGGANGILNGNFIIWYIAVPITYLEAGLVCTPKSLHSALTNGYLLAFIVAFMYILMPLLARVSSCLLTYASVNVWLLKGMEVFYCMPPPFNVSVVLSRLTNADIATSVMTTVVSHFSGLLISPILLYLMLGTSTPPLVGINISEMICSTLVPFAIGITLQISIPKFHSYDGIKTRWISLGLLLITGYHWFCDAITADSSAIQAVDILLCVIIACFGQLLMSGLCWILCSRWLSKNILLAAIFTITHKSVGLGGWILRGAYHGSAHGSAVNLPIAILPVAQLLLGCLMACWIAP